ncbi:MAG: metallopeptidase TldD-related protein [Pseudomonadota bacterium]
MAVLSNEESKAILTKVMKLSKADACEANLTGNAGGNIRYARNSVSTAGIVSDASLVVQSNFGKKVGTATINEFDEASLEKVVRRAEEMAQLSPESPEFMPPLKQQKYKKVNGFVKSTANVTPEQRAAAAAGSIGPSEKADTTAAGYLTDSANSQAMMNTEGLYAYYTDTNTNFTVTVRTNDATGSGWASRDFNDVSKLDTTQVSNIAIDKALSSRKARALEPGKYTVILEPDAAANFMGQMFFAMGARQADEGRSFMSKTGGGNKIGEQMFDERVNIYSDPGHPDVPVAPWDQSGQALDKLSIVNKGAVKNLFYSRYWAEEKDKEPVPQPNNLIFGPIARIKEILYRTLVHYTQLIQCLA